MLPIDLTGKRVLVIGGARGIGAAVVETAAAAGARVAWSDLSEEASQEFSNKLSERNIEHFYGLADCTDEAATKALFAMVREKWAGLDALVCCAGYTSPVKFMDLDYCSWQKVIAINLSSAFLATHAAINLMRGNTNGGSIVLIGSAAIVTGGGGRADYVSAKAGLEGLSRAITKEFAPDGIRCNIVHPSLIETDLLRQRHPDPEQRRMLGDEVPLRRLGQPEDISNTAVFLVSDLASYITAQSIYVDGGRTFCK